MLSMFLGKVTHLYAMQWPKWPFAPGNVESEDVWTRPVHPGHENML